MFNGEFSESKDQAAILEDIEQVESERSLEALIQWLYIGKVKYDLNYNADPTEHISAIIEFVRLRTCVV